MIIIIIVLLSYIVSILYIVVLLPIIQLTIVKWIWMFPKLGCPQIIQVMENNFRNFHGDSTKAPY